MANGYTEASLRHLNTALDRAKKLIPALLENDQSQSMTDGELSDELVELADSILRAFIVGMAGIAEAITQAGHG